MNSNLKHAQRETETNILAKRSSQIQGGGARAAVLGVNDGLVSVLCLVLTVAGAGANNHTVLLSGFAGLIAGAISMAAGEWISVKAQVELFTGILQDIRKMVKTHKDLLVTQITHSLAASGRSSATAAKAASEIAQNNDHLIHVYTKEVMGFNPDELGSPWIAAGSSFALFILGALAPLAPWFFVDGLLAISLSIIFTAIGGLVVGGYISKSSGKSVSIGALRQLGIIILASVVTYGVGYLFGVSTA